ncbi:MAG TPA: tetratricopeptide repeat protein [Verrucomicrobiae bacterium]|jgi:tetratricopeptide (TPR) repeat protein
MNKHLSRWPQLLAMALGLLVCAGCSKESKVRRLLAAAGRDYKAQKYDTAEIEYQTVLSLSQLNPVAVRQLGFIFFEEGRAPQAAAFLRKANDQDPQNTLVQLKLAELYSVSRSTNEAIRLATSVLQAEPTNEDAMILLAQLVHTNDLGSLHQRLDSELREGNQDPAACHAALGFIDLRRTDLKGAQDEFEKSVSLNSKLAVSYEGQAALCFARKDIKGVEQALKTASDLSPIRSPVRLKYVDFRVQAGDTETATNLLHEITSQAPDYIPAWMYLIKLTFARTNFDDCKQMLDRVLARDNNNFDAMLQLGVLYIAEQKVDKALDTFQQMDGLFKNIKEIKYYLGLVHLLNNEKTKAAGNLNDALALDRDYTQAALLLAQVDFRTGRLNDEISLLSQLTKRHPENAGAELALAEAYIAKEQPDQALGVYRQMAAMFPKAPEIPLRIGLVFQHSGNLRQARVAFEKALEMAPDNLSALRQITSLDIVEKHFTEAQARVTEVMGRHPKAPEIVLLQGDLYLAETKTNDAETSYSKAIEMDPDEPLGYLDLARLYVQTHKDPQALLRLSILAAKTNDIAMMMIGEIHQAAGRYEQARDAYQKLIDIKPKDYRAMNNLAYIESEFLGQVDQGLQMVENALKIRPYDPNLIDTMGWILYKKHQYASALTLIQQSVEKNPFPSGEREMHLGMTYYMMEEETPAHLYLKRAMDSTEDFPDKQLVRRRLEVLDINPANTTAAVQQELQALMNDNPDDPVPLSRLAAIQEQNGQVDAAIASLEKLLSLNNQVWPAMIRLSRLYANQKHDMRKALELAKQAHFLAPDEASACAWSGELVYRSGVDYQWAASLLREAAGQNFTEPDFNYYLALSSYSIGQMDDAVTAMQKETEQNDPAPYPEQAKQFLTLVAAAMDPAQAQSAAPLAAQILSKDPNDVPALMVTAAQSEHQGATNDAMRTYEKVLSIYPSFAPAMREMAIVYSHSARSGDLAKANDLAQKALTAMPDDPALGRILGVLAYRRADFNTSKFLLQESSRKFSGDGELFYYLGMDCYQLKDPKNCKEALQHALDLRLPDPLAADARRIMAQLK